MLGYGYDSDDNDSDDYYNYSYDDFEWQDQIPPPPVLEGCSLVTDGPVYEQYCKKIAKGSETCLLYKCPFTNPEENKVSNPIWKTRGDIVKKYFDSNISCPYRTRVGPCCPDINENKEWTSFHVRGFCENQFTPGTNMGK